MRLSLSCLFTFITTLSVFADSWTDESTGITWQYTVLDQGVMLGLERHYNGDQAVPSSTAGDLVVPDTIAGLPVVGINDYGFRACSSLTSIRLPDSVTRIGDSAFMDCFGLTSVNIPEGVTTICAHTFYGCNALVDITLPVSVTTLEWGAFSESGFVRIVLPEGIEEIPSGAFSNCEALSSISFPTTVRKIHGDAFDDCPSLPVLRIPDGVTEIEGSIRASAARVIVIPASVVAWDGVYEANSADLYAYCPPSQTIETLSACSNVFYTRENKKTWEDQILALREAYRPKSWGLMSDHLHMIVKGCTLPSAVSGTWSFEDDEIAEGDLVTVKAVAGEGYLFLGWSSIEGIVSGAETTLTFPVPEQSVTLVASFLPKALIEGMIDQRLDGRIDGEALLTKEQAMAKTEAAIEEKKEAGELFDQAGVEAKVEASIAEKVENKELVTRESIREMALGAPVIEVDGGQAKVGISLRKATALDGAWEDVTPGQAEVEGQRVKVTVDAKDGAAFYKFVVPDGEQSQTK